MRTMSFSRLLALATLVGLPACASDPKSLTHTPSDPGYHVVGNQVLGKDGRPHYFHGVARPSLEWSPNGDSLSAGDFRAMAKWKANVVRIALNQDYWLFGNGAKTYQDTVLQSVEWAKAAGLDVILDLHWSDKGVAGGGGAAQQKMADANSITFWKQVAEAYKDDGRVLFELYNEPHDISWDVWLEGGSAGDFEAVGMQELYDTVRATGAKNLVIIGGLDWAYDLSGVATHRVQGTNLMYATHPYGKNNWKPISSFDAKWGYLAATDPVIVTEFGDNEADCSTEYSSYVIEYSDRAGAHWTAWAWYPASCEFPSLISDWSGTPTAVGQVVKDALARYASQGMPVTEDGGIAQPKLDAALDSPLATDASRIDGPAAIDGPAGAGIDGPAAIDGLASIDGLAGIDGLATVDLPLAIDAGSID